jgi:adenylylsulfate kinase
MKHRKILVFGLPGAGKTSLSQVLALRLGAVHFNADQVREHINKDLGFSPADRIEQATRMGWLCDQVVKAGGTAIADFVCPTFETRAAFMLGGECSLVWCDRIQSGRFADTNRLFQRPTPDNYDYRVVENGTPEFWAELIAKDMHPAFDPQKPTALFVGRYQPFHAGHKALIVTGIEKIGQACIAVRNCPLDEKNPFDFAYVYDRIVRGMREHEGRFIVIQIPNIRSIMYGRDVGYDIERVMLDDAMHLISATNTRQAMQAPTDK